MSQHLRGLAAEQQAAETAAPMRAHDDQIGIDVLCGRDDALGCVMAGQIDWIDRYALILRDATGIGEDTLGRLFLCLVEIGENAGRVDPAPRSRTGRLRSARKAGR
jgi:hypothetical protein